jgi:hypothetical protein
MDKNKKGHMIKTTEKIMSQILDGDNTAVASELCSLQPALQLTLPERVTGHSLEDLKIEYYHLQKELPPYPLHHYL